MSGVDQEATIVRTCRVCGCTDENCTQCIQLTGQPCAWVADDVCSACAEAAKLDPYGLKEATEAIERAWEVDPEDAGLHARVAIVAALHYELGIGELAERGIRTLGDEACCELACNGGACESCPCCNAGWCVFGADGQIPERTDTDNYAIWLTTAAEHNPVAKQLLELVPLIAGRDLHKALTEYSNG